MKIESTVSTMKKKNFLEYFLDIAIIEKEDIRWLLTYIMRTERILRKVMFVKDASKLERGLYVSSECSKEEDDLRFYFQDDMHKAPDKAFNTISRYGDETIYIQLDYCGVEYCDEIAGVLESARSDEHDLTVHELKQVSGFVEHLERINMNNLLDKALDSGNEEEFNKLTSMNKVK